MRADLHMHTIYSDGVYTIGEVVDMAVKANLDMIAITDHDTFTDTTEFRHSIKTIYGIELSTLHNGESIHVLGYFKNRPPKWFVDKLEEFKERRLNRALEILSLLDKHFGIKLDNKFVYEANSITRGSIGREIVKQTNGKYTKSYVFSHFIGHGCKAYIPSLKISTEEGIKLIKDAGGLVVLAHPMLYKTENMMEVIKMGFDGVEAIYPHFHEDIQKYRDLAGKYQIRFITGGSDFHNLVGPDDGSNHGNIGDSFIEGNDLIKFLGELGYER